VQSAATPAVAAVAVVGQEATRSAQLICDAGSFCVDGLKLPCPGGTYGAVAGYSAAGPYGFRYALDSEHDCVAHVCISCSVVHRSV
jgi:hypothetical protein